jgi:hypothetical protein
MIRATARRFIAGSSAGSVSPTEVFAQLQLGVVPSATVCRTFISTHFEDELARRGVTPARLQHYDVKKAGDLLKTLFFERYLLVPYTLVTLHLVFTDTTPMFSDAGPNAGIAEIALWAPDKEAQFSSLVRPSRGAGMTAAATKQSGITDGMLAAAPPFADVWAEANLFINSAAPTEAAKARVLVLSHSSKQSDVRMLQWHCEHDATPVAPHYRFGNTTHLIRELHRRRPVTRSRLPPSWNLAEQALWLDIGGSRGERYTRALPEAQLTWDIAYHTMDRYGDMMLQPRQQLVTRFFDAEAREAVAVQCSSTGGGDSQFDTVML